MAFLMMLTVAYFAHKNKWGGDIPFSRSRFGKALVETRRGGAAGRWRCGG